LQWTITNAVPQARIRHGAPDRGRARNAASWSPQPPGAAIAGDASASGVQEQERRLVRSSELARPLTVDAELIGEVAVSATTRATDPRWSHHRCRPRSCKRCSPACASQRSKADATEGATAVGANAQAYGSGATALGVNAKADGTGAIAIGYGANSNASGGIAIGDNTTANGTNAFAYGTGAVANGVNVTAIGAGARAEGFNTNALAIGSGALANGTSVIAIGAGATATGTKSTAIGAGASTTRNNQLMLGDADTEITVANLAGQGTALVAANSDGTLQRSSSVSLQQIDQAVNSTIPQLQKTTNKLESAARGLGQAVESSGAIAAAMSAIPEVSLQEDEPMRCGVGAGGYGSQYAISAGCALRVADRLHLNGALAYTPSIDYQYGSTPSVAGRLGFSFPLGKINRKKSSMNAREISAVSAEVNSLRQELTSRDQQIAELKDQLAKLLESQAADTSQRPNQAQQQLTELLRSRIEELEQDKVKAKAEDRKQNQLIEELQAKLTKQQSMFDKLMEQVKRLIDKPVGTPVGITDKAVSRR
jgi:hypothetical protein